MSIFRFFSVVNTQSVSNPEKPRSMSYLRMYTVTVEICSSTEKGERLTAYAKLQNALCFECNSMQEA